SAHAFPQTKGPTQHKPQQQITIPTVGQESPTIPAIRNQPLTILGMVTRLLPTVAAAKIPRTIATVMPMLCAATGMNGMTAIGGNNTMSLSCLSEADTIIKMREIGIWRGVKCPTLTGTITVVPSTP